MKAARMVLVISLVFAAQCVAFAAGDAPAQDEVDGAIARGLAYLKEVQGGQGEWSYSFNHNHDLGITALAALALLENGVGPADPAVARAGRVVKRLAARSDQTYDLSLAILFLARVQSGQAGENDRLIRSLAGRLAAGGPAGLWGYNVPAGADEGGGPSAVRPRRPRGVLPGQAADNSNTQFALLGVWAAGRHGFDPDAALEAIDGHFRRTQDRRGRWGYVPGDAGRDAMTCAGLMGLAVAAARPALAERQTARARGAALAADPAFAAALAAVADDARRIGAASDVYYLWSLERVCVALGLRDLDGLDWYGLGARELLRRQGRDGAWPEGQWGRLPGTCLALLFLRRANLAFELDRVLKLPARDRPAARAAAVVAEDATPPDAKPAAGEATVVVTGASDARFPEVTVDFEVKRPDGSFVLDATRDDVSVTEDGAPVTVLGLQAPTAREARPVTVALVVDRSQSMEEEDRIGSLKRAVAHFLKGLPAGSRVAVVAFGSEVEEVCPFTGDLARAEAAVDRLRPAGATRFYDAVAVALDLIATQPGRRAVLALTDGEDTFSRTAAPESLVAAARTLGVPVHTLGLGSDDEIEAGVLGQLARATRGQYYPAREADQLRSVYEQLAARLRSGYTLVYRSDRAVPDGTLRPVRVSYRSGAGAGETAVFIPGMVVPAAGWPKLFVGILAALGLLALLPGWAARAWASARQ